MKPIASGRRVGPIFDLLWIHKGHVCIRFQSRQKAGLHAGQGVLIYPHTRFEGYSVTPETQASVQHFELLAPAGRFLQDLRDVEAKRLLHETLEPIKEISQRVGYADVVSFHRAFKSRTGQTPADYRGSLRLSFG